MTRCVEILDSTLREGEQTPGVTFTSDEKIEIANLLDDFGVDYIEGGHPAVSPDVKLGLERICDQGYGAQIIAHSRLMRSDIDLVIDSGADWIGLFMSVMGDRLKYDFRKDLDEVCTIINDGVEYAKEHGLKVRYTPEDTLRSDIQSVIRAAKSARDAGADRISIADTVGASNPDIIGKVVKRIGKEVGLPVNVHCHNDLGLALANSLAAIENGATTVDTCVNGLGERAGITDLSQFVLCLKTLYDYNGGWNLRLLSPLSERVQSLSGFRIADNAPVVGRNAFRHNAGLHVSATLKRPEFYEVFSAESLGRERIFHLDKMSGRGLLGDILERNEIKKDPNTLDKLYNLVKSREKGSFSESELLEIARSG